MGDDYLVEKSRVLNAKLAGLSSALVAYSGGVDSAYLAWAARNALGDSMLAVLGDRKREQFSSVRLKGTAVLAHHTVGVRDHRSHRCPRVALLGRFPTLFQNRVIPRRLPVFPTSASG